MTGLETKLHTRLGGFCLNFELTVPGQGVTGLFGASGSGKTTALRCIAGLCRARSGYVEFNGEVWQDGAADLFVPPHKRGVGYVSQEADLFPHLSVRDNLLYALRRVPANVKSIGLTDVVDWLGLNQLLVRSVSNLSGGERQRVAIARALLVSPRILLMDEPISALDEPARREVLAFLEPMLARLELPVVYVSHSLTEVTRLSDHLVWMAEGTVREAGPVSQVLGRVDFARWWGAEAGTVIDGTVREHDQEYQLTVVSTPLGEFFIHGRPEPPGTNIRLRINGRDVSLGLTPQEGSSILNELKLSVLEITDTSPSACLVRLGQPDTPDPVLLSRITRKSCNQLKLEPGSTVFARVKSVAVVD
ncbi:molybdenum ABC transporter ATP-binding protein [Gemmatimonadota bacterium]